MASLSTIYSVSDSPEGRSYPFIANASSQSSINSAQPSYAPNNLSQGRVSYAYPNASRILPRRNTFGNSIYRRSRYDFPHSTNQSLYGSRPTTRNSGRDPWAPIDPFRSQTAQATPVPPSPSFSIPSTPSLANSSVSSLSSRPTSPDTLPPPAVATKPPNSYASLIFFLLDTVPRRCYLYILLHMPALYFNRVTRVFQDAELSMPDIKDMMNAVEDVYQANWYVYPTHGGHAPQISPALAKFRLSWEDFIASMTSEWQSVNILAVLLLSALLTMLQIGGIEGDPVSRTGVLLSLVCALMSLLYGSIYMARFGTMNRMYKAAAWAEEARRTRTLIWWNVWVFLSMPAVWLAWSIIFFSASILSFVWRAGSSSDPEDPVRLVPHQELGPRIAVTFVFALGLVYFLLVLKTLKRYGSSMDKEWRARTATWRTEKVFVDANQRLGEERQHEPVPSAPPSPSPMPRSPVSMSSSPPPPPPRRTDIIPTPSESSQLLRFVPGPYRVAVKAIAWRPRAFNQLPTRGRSEKFNPFEIIDLGTPAKDRRNPPFPSLLSGFHVYNAQWNEFMHHVNLAWAGLIHIPNMSAEDCLEARETILQDLVDTWNNAYFLGRQVRVTFSLPDSVTSNGNDASRSPEPATLGNTTPSSPILYLTYVSEEYSCNNGRFFPFPPPSLSPYLWFDQLHTLLASPSNNETELSQNSQEYEHPSLSHPLNYQDAPGPYKKALECSGSFPSVFYDRVYNWGERDQRVLADLSRHGVDVGDALRTLDIANLRSDAWENFTIDLRRVLTGRFPVPNVNPDDCLKLRPLILADLLETWNVKYFLKRGVEVTMTLDGEGVYGTSDERSNEITGRRQHPRMPYVIYLDPALHGLTKTGSDDVDVSGIPEEPPHQTELMVEVAEKSLDSYSTKSEI